MSSIAKSCQYRLAKMFVSALILGTYSNLGRLPSCAIFKELTIIIINFYLESSTGMTLSPPELVSACLGERLDFICTTNREFIQWNVTVIEQGSQETHSREARLVAYGGSPLQSLTVNGIPFTVAINSSSESRPLISTLSVANVTADVNGTKVNCTGFTGSEAPQTMVTTVIVTNLSKSMDLG